MHGPSLLRVDLRARTSEVLRLPAETLALFPGGRGLAGFLLRPHIGLPWDHPDMPVLVLAGPLAGTTAPCAGRCHLASRSPLTLAPGDASVGGNLGPQLRAAGLYGLVLSGKSPLPLGLEIRDREVRFTDASALRGRDTTAVFDALDGFGSVACVGPAAENGVLYASLAVDRLHAAERCGLGLCLAAKGLKYLAVSGSNHASVVDPAGLAAARADIERLLRASPVLQGPQGFGRFGTAALCDLTQSRSMMPTDNFRRSRFPGAARCNAPALAQGHPSQAAACPGCPVGCVRVADNRPLPGFQALSHFTALLGIHDPDLAVQANDLCARLGLDPVSAAASLAAFAEIREQRLAPEQVLALLADTGLGLGQGVLLGQGAQRLARELGRPGAAMAVKGLELPAYDPRGAYGLALGLAVSTRGACAERANAVSHEILRKPVATDRFSFQGKARIIKLGEDQVAAAQCLPVCAQALLAAGLEEYARAAAAVTGLPLTARDLALAGERSVYQERLMLAELGFSAADDDLPTRFFLEPGDPGQGFETPPLSRPDFLEARARYYRVRGLDENGLPVKAKTEELGLAWNAS